jgi:hypothetical protein
MKLNAKLVTALFFVCVSAVCHAEEIDWRLVINLAGNWKFSIGDNLKWASPTYDDQDWETMRVPARWEQEGFNGYNGFAWYRTSFNGAELKNKNKSFNLFLGYIDDSDEVYFNGHLIGTSGSMPPNFQTAYNALRNYYIPTEYINFNGRNVIAVRVFDTTLDGGIVSGDIGVYSDFDDRGITVNLRGMWDFMLLKEQFGRARPEQFMNNTKHEPPLNSKWQKISVPVPWDHQGFQEYDGSAWYRKQFEIPKALAGEELVLVLGKIDDADHTYFNGKLVGSTTQHDKLRVYNIPSELVNAGGFNIILIYVEDYTGAGGIYDGPVGVMKQTEFTRYMRYRDN